jgi:hypothetical protein
MTNFITQGPNDFYKYFYFKISIEIANINEIFYQEE